MFGDVVEQYVLDVVLFVCVDYCEVDFVFFYVVLQVFCDVFVDVFGFDEFVFVFCVG